MYGKRTSIKLFSYVHMVQVLLGTTLISCR